MITRKELSLETTVNEFIIVMSEGNPGATSVLCGIYKQNPHALVHLDDMNLRGTQVWEAFRYCNKDIETLINRILARDPQMVQAVNQSGMRGNHPHLAVERGAVNNRRFLS